MFVSVCNSLYLSICLYLFICSYLCTSLRSSSQGSNSQQQSATVHKQSSSHCSHCCLFISVYTFISLHICLYQTYIRTYMHIFVHICKYSSYLAWDQSPEQISPELISGTRQIIIVAHMC